VNTEGDLHSGISERGPGTRSNFLHHPQVANRQNNRLVGLSSRLFRVRGRAQLAVLFWLQWQGTRLRQGLSGQTV